MKPSLLLAAMAAHLAVTDVVAHSAQWVYRWPALPGEAAPKVEVAPLKYDKSWAYAVEIDDGPTSTLEVSLPLLARYQWNDAPPGIAGGANRPFVGTAAVTLNSIETSNSAYLTRAQLDELKIAGWNIVNHSYWHTGNHWDKTQFLKPEDFRRELFWSQVFFAQQAGDGRGATHFVYPNGDPYYQPYLTAYGLRSASRVGGSSPRNLRDPKWNPLDLTRNYLDTGVWVGQTNALAGFPKTPQSGDFVIDFTHGMNPDAKSENNKLWVARLDHIARHYGPQGDNSMWVAPTDEIVNYHLAAQAARVSMAPGEIKVTLPDDAPASALTLKISGLSAQATAPTQATMIRQGTTVWLTTPVIGQAGAKLPAPKLKQVYSGPVKDLKWDEPVKIAGVRLMLSSPVAADSVFKMEIETPTGLTESLLSEGATIDKAWGRWLLFPTIPDREAIAARALRVSPDPNLRQMEVWVLAS